jgi:hypothetical protein
MLSSKLQNDLMAAYQKVYEEKRGHAAGSDDTEKQASQLASDVRYKAKGKVPEGASKEEKMKIFLQILGASPAPNVVKAMAKQKLLGEEVVKEMRFDDGKEGTEKRKEALRKKRGMTKKEMDKHPQFKTEGASYGITRGSGKPSGAMAAFVKKKKKKDEEVKEGVAAIPAIASKVLPSIATGIGAVGTMMQIKKRVPKDTPYKLKKNTRAQQELDPTPEQKKAKQEQDEMDRKFDKSHYELQGNPLQEEEKAPRRQKGAMAYDGPNKERSEAADRILAKTKKKREEKMKKEEYVGEMKVKQVVKPKPARNPQNMALPKNVKSGVNYQNMAQSYVPVGNIFNEKKMDPVGQEDKDIDNDGDHDSTDKYLLKRRKAIGKAIAKKRGRVKEGFSAWRIDLDFNEQVKK